MLPAPKPSGGRSKKRKVSTASLISSTIPDYFFKKMRTIREEEDEHQEPAETAPKMSGDDQDPWGTDSWEELADETMSAVYGGVDVKGEPATQEQPSLGQVGGENHGDDTGMVEFELDDSWEEFVATTIDDEQLVLETSQDKHVSDVVVGTNTWGTSGDSWEILADMTASNLELQDQSLGMLGLSYRCEDDMKTEKEDDFKESKDDLEASKTRRSPSRPLETIVEDHPPPGGSLDQDCHGQDTTRGVVEGGTIVPDKTCTSTLLECGAAQAEKPGLTTTGQPRLSQHNLSSDDCPFDEMGGGVERNMIPEMPGTPGAAMMSDERTGMIMKDDVTGLMKFRANLGVFVTSTPTPSSGKLHTHKTSKKYQCNDYISDVSACDPGIQDDGAVVLDRNNHTLPQPTQVMGEGGEGDVDHVALLSRAEKGGEVGRLSDDRKMTGGGQGGVVDDRSDNCSFTSSHTLPQPT